MKKILALVLALALVFGAVGAVSAEECIGCDMDNFNQMLKPTKPCIYPKP